MKKSRVTAEQIIGFVKQANAGMAVSKLAGNTASARPASMPAVPTTAAWQAEDARRPKEPEFEDDRLKRVLAEAYLDIEVLKIGFGGER